MKKLSLAFIIFIILVGLGIYVYSFTRKIQTKIFVPRSKTQASAPTVASNLQNKIPFNILLLGYGGGNHEGTYLTDSMIMAHFDPKQKKILLISIPRDIWIKLPLDNKNGSYWKINAAYALGMDDQRYPDKPEPYRGTGGGGRLAEYAVGKLTGLQVNNFVGGDFAGFTKTIDTLGGVDINVEKTFDDIEYPLEGKEDELCGVEKDAVASYSAQIATGSAQISEIFPCRFEKLHFSAGLQTMNGETALKYVRSRHSLQDGTDFGRAKRQRNLIVAVKEKILSIGFIPKIIPFISSLQDDIRTDLTPDDLKELALKANELGEYAIQSIALTDDNYLKDSFTSDGQSVLMSKDGPDNWTSVHNWITSYTDPNYVVKKPAIQVENAGGKAGLAKKVTDKLKAQGLTLLEPTTSATLNETTTIVTTKKIDPQIITRLMKEFAVKAIKTNPNLDGNYDILITLGKDYALTPLPSQIPEL